MSFSTLDPSSSSSCASDSTSTSPASPFSSISSVSSSSSSSYSSPWSNMSSSSSPLTPRTRFFLGRPSPVPLRRPLLPTQWTQPSLMTATTTTTATTPVPVPATPLCPSISPIPSTKITKINDPLIPPFSALTRPRQLLQQQQQQHKQHQHQHQHQPTLRKFSVSAPCTPLLTRPPQQQTQHPLHPQKLVFASGAVGTASALGHVFGRPLQAKESTPCTPLNCAQLRNNPQHPLLHQQAQCPSHTFQQQCQVHKRFRLFRQKPLRCQVHNTSSSSTGPNYIFPPTTVHPLIVRPEKILLEHHEEPVPATSSSIYESWRASALTTSESTSSRLSSYSTASLSLSTCSYNQGSDSEGGYHNSGNPFRSPNKKKNKKSNNVNNKPQPRCLCYLNSPSSQDSPLSGSSGSRNTGSGYLSQQPPLSTPSSWYPQKHQNKEASRLRRMWNDSTIFHWSKPSSGLKQHEQDDQLQQLSPSVSQTMAEQPQSNLASAADGDVTSMDHIRQPSPADNNLGGIPMRMSLSGTMSDGSNMSYSSDVDDDLLEDRRIPSQRVSFKDHSQGGSGSGSRRAREDMKAIARQQAEASLEGYKDYESFRTGNQAMRINRQQQQQHQQQQQVSSSFGPSEIQTPRPQAQAFIQTDDEDEDDDHHRQSEDDDDEEDWDIQSDSGARSSSPMYSAEAQKPTSYSTVTLPLSPPSGPSASSKKKPSNAALNSLRSRQRCLSLPADTLPPGFIKMSSTPSENWDEDFDIGSADINVPTQVAESQISLHMDIYNIRDFASQIEDLKNLRASLRLASSSLKARNPKKHQDLSMLFQRDWEQAEVIIDLGEIAQTSTNLPTPTTTSPITGRQQQQNSQQQQQLAAGPLSLVSGKGVQPQHHHQLTTKKSNHFNKNSKASWSRRPALSTVTLPTPQPFYMQQQPQRQPTPPAAIPIRTTSLSAQSRTLSQSSSLTGTTLAGSLEEDSCTADEEEFKKQQQKSLTIDIEAAVEGTAIRRSLVGLSPKSWRRKSSEASTSTLTRDSCSSPAGLGLCSSPSTPLPDDLGPMKGFGNGQGTHEEMEASFRRYQKNRHQHQSQQPQLQPYRHTYNYAPTHAGASSMSPKRLYQKQQAIEGEDDTAGEDDGYESYGRPLSSSNSSSGGVASAGPSVGVISPIPSDRHMQVLKDILTEGLGSEVARQYMFKHGEQDHVRFSVEVIPGLLWHLKGLQRRLGDQLLELQQLTVIV